MTTIIPVVRDASTDELAYLRTHGQHSKLYLAFPQPAIVFKALVNDAAPNCDMTVWISYDGASTYGYGGNAYQNILPDMTLWVGSSEGACDLGIARIRKAASATKLFIGRTSEVKFADEMFLTVIDEYGLWPRIKYIQEGPAHVDFMDFDVAYVPGADGQHSKLAPIVIMGPDRVLWYQGLLATHPGNSISTQMDASASYSLSSVGAATYLWTCATGTIDDDDIANPNIHFHAIGTHRVSCTVTIDGVSFTGHRTIVVFDNSALPVSDFKLNSCAGDYETGGWNFKVTMYDSADLPLVRDRAKCILFSRDWYGDITTLPADVTISFEASSKKIKRASSLGLDIFTEGMTIKVSGSASNDGEYIVVTSNAAYLVVNKVLIDEAASASITINSIHSQKEINIGQVTGVENIICEGWIAKEDLNLDIQGGTAAFTVHGPQYWFNQMEGYISGLLDSATDPSEWNYMYHLTVDKGLWDLLHWRSTATVLMDCFMSGDTQLIPCMENASIGSIWDEFVGQAARGMKMCCCDRYGRFILERDGQLTNIGTRAYTNVMTVELYDRTGEITLERLTVPAVDMVDLSGVWYDGSTGYAVRGLAGGHLMGRYGKTETDDTIVFADQADCTMMAGLLLAKRNNKYPTMSFELASNMRLIDICPQQQLFVVMTTDENPREISVSNNIFVRKLAYSFDDKSKSISVQVDGEPEVTDTVNAIAGEVPVPTLPPSDDWTLPIMFPPILPGWPVILPIPVPPAPPVPITPVPPGTGNQYPACADVANGPYNGMWDKFMLQSDPILPESDRSAYIWKRCAVRRYNVIDYYVNATTLLFDIVDAYGTSIPTMHVYGVDSAKNRLVEATVTSLGNDGSTYHMQAVFDALWTDNVIVDGFEVRQMPGYYIPGPAFDIDGKIHFHMQPDGDPVYSLIEQGEFWNMGGVHGGSYIINDSGISFIQPNYAFCYWEGEVACYFDGSLLGQPAHLNFHVQQVLDADLPQTEIKSYLQVQAIGGDLDILRTIESAPGSQTDRLAYLSESQNDLCEFAHFGAGVAPIGNQNAVDFWLTISHPWTAKGARDMKVLLLLIAGDGTPAPMIITVGPMALYNIC